MGPVLGGFIGGNWGGLCAEAAAWEGYRSRFTHLRGGGVFPAKMDRYCAAAVLPGGMSENSQHPA